MTTNDQQKRYDAQAKYKPEAIRCIIIAEAPPTAPDRYFYFPKVTDHDSLFREMMKALYRKDGMVPELSRDSVEKSKWLSRFQSDGFYLIDLCLDPLTGNKSDYQTEREHAVPDLIRRLQDLQAEQIPIIPIKHAVCALLHEQLPKSGFQRVYQKQIPFPGSGQQANFQQAFNEALDWLGKVSSI